MNRTAALRGQPTDDPDAAIEACTNFLADAQGDQVIQGKFYRAFAYFQKHEYYHAAQDFSAVLSVRPVQVAYLDRGIAYLSQMDDDPSFADRAISDLTEAEKLQPRIEAKTRAQFWQAYLVRATTNLKKGEDGQALADEAVAIRLNANKTDAIQADIAQVYTQRALESLAGGQYDRAASDLQEAIKLNPATAGKLNPYLTEAQSRRAGPYADIARGDLHFHSQDYERAIQDYTAAIRANSKLAYAHLKRGYAYLELRCFACARLDFDIAIRLDSDGWSGHYARGLLNQQMDRFDEAAADFDQASAIIERVHDVAYEGEKQQIEDARKSLDFSSTMQDHWISYLQDIQAAKTYANWSGAPYDLYLKRHNLKEDCRPLPGGHPWFSTAIWIIAIACLLALLGWLWGMRRRGAFAGQPFFRLIAALPAQIPLRHVAGSASAGFSHLFLTVRSRHAAVRNVANEQERALIVAADELVRDMQREFVKARIRWTTAREARRTERAIRQKALEKRRAEIEEANRKEAEAKRAAQKEAEARRKAEEVRRQAEEQARRAEAERIAREKAEAERKAEEARRATEEQAKRAEAEEACRQAEEEAERAKAERIARERAEAERKAEEARRAAEEQAKRAEFERLARERAEAEREAEEARRQAEEDAKRAEEVHRLMKVLADSNPGSDWGNRAAAAWQLGKLGPAAKPALATLIDALYVMPRRNDYTGNAERIRGSAALALSQIGDVYPELVEMFRSPATRDRAARALTCTGEPRAIQLIIDGLHDEDEQTRLLALDVLNAFGNHQAKQLLFDKLPLLLRDPSAIVRQKAMDICAHSSQPRRTELLAAALLDPDSSIHRWALQTLGDLGDRKVVAHIQEALKGGDIEIRKETVMWAIKWRRHFPHELDGDILCVLADMLRSHDIELRLFAAKRLRSLEYGCTGEILQLALQDREESVRACAIDSLLGKQYEEHPADALVKMLYAAKNMSSYEGIKFRRKVVEKLGENDCDQVRIAFIQCLDDPDWAVRSDSKRALLNKLPTEPQQARRFAQSYLGPVLERACRSLSSSVTDDRLEGASMLARVASKLQKVMADYPRCIEAMANAASDKNEEIRGSAKSFFYILLENKWRPTKEIRRRLWKAGITYWPRWYQRVGMLLDNFFAGSVTSYSSTSARSYKGTIRYH